jgi:hypothetical protein
MEDNLKKAWKKIKLNSEFQEFKSDVTTFFNQEKAKDITEKGVKILKKITKTLDESADKLIVNTSKNKAISEAIKMTSLPMKDIPKEAVQYMVYLTSNSNYSDELCLIAYSHYNQAVLNMSCEDEKYKITESGLSWFKEKEYC